MEKAGIALDQGQIGPDGMAQSGLAKVFFERAEDQGQGGAQLVADVGNFLFFKYKEEKSIRLAGAQTNPAKVTRSLNYAQSFHLRIVDVR